jgi:multicomponent Na+:H+ antiporter subunit B
MTHKDTNPILSLVSRVVSPFIMLYALYVIFHGHYSPGGGFQGGTPGSIGRRERTGPIAI